MKSGRFRMGLQFIERPPQRILVIPRGRPAFHVGFYHRRQMVGSSNFGLHEG
jgi:hypothetical protein